MIVYKTADEIERMRVSGRIAAAVRRSVAREIRPGVTTQELDTLAGDLIAGHGATSAFLGYRGYPGNVCISVNDEVVHGIPGDRRIQAGDIVSLDVGVYYDEFIGDNAETVMVGVTDPEVVRLCDVTRNSLYAAIEQAVPGGKLGDVSNAVERVAREAGMSVVREFVGHGVGKDLHEDPQVPNFGPAGRGPRLKTGMTLAIEPMVNLGAADVEILDDGWTVLTRDRSPSAHFEHTVAILENGPEILTLGDDES